MKAPNLVNLTPHEVNIVTPSGTRTVPPSGTVARRREHTEFLGYMDGIPVFEKTYWEVVDLPERVEGTIFIVSRMVLEYETNRGDLVSPGSAVRDESGKIVGCEGLIAGPRYWI